MSDVAIPPVLNEAPVEDARPKWRWAVHLGLLIAYVLALGLGGLVKRSAAAGPTGAAMPSDVRGLVVLCAFEFALFAIVVAVAWGFSRAKADELFLKWRGGVRPILWGIVYSVALRFAILIVAVLVVLPIYFLRGQKSIEKMRPKVEAVIDTKALENPVYLLAALTLVSFVVAGFREEFWRAGVLAGLAGVAPRLFGTPRGRYAAVLVAAVIFGLGHLPQGAGGVFLTGALGIGLGSIIVLHRSIWPAVIAHGFFDATTFAGIYLLLKYVPGALKNAGIGA